MQHTTFRQLEVFTAVVRHGSFTRAAEELGLSQPTVSMQVKKLTEEVGLPLFEALGRQVQLTEAGTALKKTCQEIFDALARFDMAVADLQGLKVGKLCIAAVNTAKYFIPLLLGAFCKRYPDIRATLEVTGRDEILRRLDRKLDDLTIMSEPPEAPDLQTIPFLDNLLVALAPFDHPLVRQKHISPQRVTQEPFLLREGGSGTRHRVEQFFAARHLALDIRMELANNEAIKQAIVGGLGISVLSLHAVSDDIAAGRLKILDVQGFPLQGHWYAVWHAGRPLSVATQAFLELLQNEASTLLTDASRPHSSAIIA